MKQDSNIIQIPKCKCGKDGLIYFGDILVCGDCAVKLHNHNNKMIALQQEAILKCQG